MAGPDLAPRSFHAAAVPDGLGGRWQGGAFERIEAENRNRLMAHFAESAKACLFQRDTPPANLLGGRRFAGAPTAAELGLTKSETTTVTTETARLIASIPDDLSIPDFLKRTNPAVPATAADEPAPCDGAGSGQVALTTESNDAG